MTVRKKQQYKSDVSVNRVCASLSPLFYHAANNGPLGFLLYGTWSKCKHYVKSWYLSSYFEFKGDAVLFRPHHIVESPPETCQCACPFSPRHILYLEIKYGSWKWEIDWYALSSRNQDYCNIPEACRLAPFSTMASFSRSSHPLAPPPTLEQVQNYVVYAAKVAVSGSRKTGFYILGSLAFWVVGLEA